MIKQLKKKEISAKQRVFVNEYMISGNQTQSAIEAGYSPVSAHTTGNRLMNNPLVRATINRAMVDAGIDIIEVLRDLNQTRKDTKSPKSEHYNPIVFTKVSEILLKAGGLFKDDKEERFTKAEQQQFINNVSKVFCEILIKYIPDTEQLRLASDEVYHNFKALDTEAIE